MQKVSIEWQGKCSRHPRFSGTLGRGAVKGGCPVCDALCKVEEAAEKLRAACEGAEIRAREADWLHVTAVQRRRERAIRQGFQG